MVKILCKKEGMGGRPQFNIEFLSLVINLDLLEIMITTVYSHFQHHGTQRACNEYDWYR